MARENVYLRWSNCCAAFLAVQSLPENATNRVKRHKGDPTEISVRCLICFSVVAVEPVFQTFFNTSHGLIPTYTTDLLPLNVPGWWGSRLVTNGAFAAKAPYNLASVTTSLTVILLKAWWKVNMSLLIWPLSSLPFAFPPLCFNCLAKPFCHVVDKSEAILLL